ncbi:MAG: cryptochrome/photolyase family protein [Candidatus Hermodarchaeia archaeon]|jgi:deoxyribodipyrimidine photo-lyase
MESAYKNSLFIFRRDLRLEDNLGLINALTNSSEVVPCFFFDHRLLSTKRQHHNAIQFMVEALKDLDDQLTQKKGQLFCFSDLPEKKVPSLISSLHIDAIFVNRDYTPFSQRRDSRLRKICDQVGVDFHQFADSLLNEPEMVHKSNNEPYKVFTPFFEKAKQIPVASLKTNPHRNYSPSKILRKKILTSVLKKYKFQTNERLLFQGSRSSCLKILEDLSPFRDYDIKRDFPFEHGTTHLSPYLKFGLSSIREVHAAISNQLGATHPLIRQLYWRDFYTHIAFHYSYVFKRAFKARYEKLQWNNSKTLFQAWCEGKTGFPIVDAGMRQLNTTGWMHNRLRMIVASFLTKDFHIDWRWGERYFAKQLVDYDPAVNNGNWQWAASTGVDAQPYFRIFNPWRQQEKYDSNCEYIKKWIPELSQVEPKMIHRWFEPTELDSQLNYPKPLVDHKLESQYSKEHFARTYST